MVIAPIGKIHGELTNSSRVLLTPCLQRAVERASIRYIIAEALLRR